MVNFPEKISFGAPWPYLEDSTCHIHVLIQLSNFFFKKSHSFTSGWPVFPAPLVKEIIFFLLYILASFVADKVSIGRWIYLWAFYFVPLIYISVFVPVPYSLDDCLCSRVWSQAGWLFHFHSSFSRLLWLFKVFYISIQIVKLFVLVLWRIPLVAW